MFSKGSLASVKVFHRHSGKGAPVTRPAYLLDVVRKLRNLEDFQGLSEEELNNKADELTDPVKLWSLYFSGVVLDPARDHIEMNLQGVSESEATPSSEAHAGQTHSIPIKLRIVPVRSRGQYGAQSFTSLMLEHYGALHASLLVCDAVQLEWSTAGLVVPTGKAIPPDAQEASAKLATAGELSDQHYSTIEEVIVQEFEAAHIKKERMDRLINIVSRYNKSYFYHPIFRSCQKFVADSMSSLGYPVHPELEGSLGNYYKEVKKGVKQSLTFNSHADLDTYVEHALESRGVTLPEAEYLMSRYFLFHVTSMTESKTVDRWQCQVQSCRMAQLEATFDLCETLAYSLLHSSTA